MASPTSTRVRRLLAIVSAFLVLATGGFTATAQQSTPETMSSAPLATPVGVVEVATRRTFDDELHDRILEPLNLKDISVEMGKALPDDIVDGYQMIEGELVNVSAINLTRNSTAGGMVSTTSDVARFARAALDGDLLSPASFKEMFTVVSMGRPGLLDGGMGVFHAQTPNGELVNMAPDEGASVRMRDEAIQAAMQPPDQQLRLLARSAMDPAAPQYRPCTSSAKYRSPSTRSEAF